MSRYARPWARPLVPLYRAVQAAEEALRARGVLTTRTLSAPVVSIGSLSAGGAGKTPVVMAMARLLGDAGWDIDVLTRGYGRSGKGVERVELEHATASVLVNGDGATSARSDAAEVRERRVLIDSAAARYGDEAVLLAARTGRAVWVGGSRYAAGLRAEADGERARCVHVLDDGFQHRELARAIDVVLVTAEDVDDTLLPAGNLREPMRALQRADAVVVRENEMEDVAPKVWPHLRTGAQMWTVRRSLRFPPPLGVLTAGLRPLAFCAIARPAGFAASLAAAGCGVVDTVVFRDHQALGAAQLREIIAFAKQLKASGLVTTEKDFVKLAPRAIAQLEAEVGPLMVAALDAEMADSARVLRFVEDKLNAGRA